MIFTYKKIHLQSKQYMNLSICHSWG